MVKFVMFIIFLLLTNTVKAQVFKCETLQKKTIYQDRPCENSNAEREINIQRVDPEKILAAQERLRNELFQHQKLKTIKAEVALKEKQIKAIEAQTRSNEELAYAATKNTHAIDRNTEAKSRYRNPRNYLYRYSHFGYKPRNIQPYIYRHPRKHKTKRTKSNSDTNSYATRLSH